MLNDLTRDELLTGEDEFKNKINYGIVDTMMSDDFVHHLSYPGLPAGRAGMKAMGAFVTAALTHIRVVVTLTISQGDLVANRVEAVGTRVDTGQPIQWVENHIYRVVNGAITELCPAGGPDLS